MKRNTTLALALCGAFAAPAFADAIDVNKLVADQLRATGKLAAGYKAKTGRDMPSNVTPNVIFQGEVGGKGVQFTVPGVIPERPLVLSQAPVSNCSSRDVLRRVSVEKTSTVSSSVTNSDTVETGRELSVTVGYESPFGASASSTASVSQKFSATTTKEQSVSDSLAWKDELEVPVEAGKAVKVQFVVTEQRLDRVPYTANLVLRGKAQANFLQGQEGFTWVKIAGSNLPANVIRPGFQQNNRPLAVCRTYGHNRWRIGKSEGTTCWYAVHELAAMPFGMKSGFSTGDFEVLVGSAQQVQMGDPYAADAYIAPPPQGSTDQQKVCFAQHNGWSLPGYIDGRNCVSEWDSKAVITQNYKVLRTPQTGGVVVDYDLDRDLTEAQRTFNLRGVFSGVNALYGDFRIGPSAAADCGLVTASSGPKMAGGGTAGAASATKAPPPPTGPVVLAAAAKGEAPLPPGTARKKTQPKKP